MKTKEEIAKFIKESVDYLTNESPESSGCYLELDSILSVGVRWEEGYGDEWRDDCVQDKKNPDWALNVGILVTNPYDTMDGWLMPYDEKTGDIVCETSSISPDTDYEQEAEWLLKDYNEVAGFVNEDGSFMRDCKEGKEEY